VSICGISLSPGLRVKVVSCTASASIAPTSTRSPASPRSNSTTAKPDLTAPFGAPPQVRLYTSSMRTMSSSSR
jgi:hypothetical protein